MIRLLTFIKTNWVVFTLFTLIVITTLSLWPLKELPSVPGTDKAHHLIAYAVLMFPTALRKPKKWILFGLLFIAYSGAIELLQPYVNRYGEWLDMAANISGLVCGLVIAELINYLFTATSNSFR
ncbi:MAG: VanZ family protein [Candidatus Scalindua sp. AMX11]|nr:MAG: VanZ family protein [Candidatus Scalindua sp.]NOG86148.1 VanZ family protein [Planctomycetota bacterium]RZV98908.1 MAG: VanZ family protein [Candidatus Scalindua sp. SCAELEC01]TDE66901.1 MAG: VanZ family protein [Candidatus Scalindua sp. AMX11]